MNEVNANNTIQAGLRAYFEKPVFATFLLGISQGFPLTLVISLSGFWLARYGVDKKTIGLLALATTPYVLKPLWAPIIDRLELGVLARIVGHRRIWMFLIQGMLAIAILCLSFLRPDQQIETVAFLIVLIGFLSASQDIVIDAYRIEIVDDSRQGYGAAMVVFGYRAGNLLAGYGVLKIADAYGWNLALSLLIFLLIPGVIAALWVGEPEKKAGNFIADEKDKAANYSKTALWVYEAVILPFKEFMRRDNWYLILLFIVFFKAGDAIAAIMTAPLIVELGFSDSEIADANKLVGAAALWIGIGLGSWLYFAAGAFRALFITGVLMMVTNLAFAWLALVGHDVYALAFTIGAENFATGLGNTVTVAYFGSLCNVSFTATQYALLSSLASLARSFIGSSGGYIAEATGWVDFFIYSTFAAVPGLILLGILWKLDIRAQKE
ncbi:MFS transporter [Kordiimonas sp. SCSIO 12610]|uniref:AmpG family muropeptide MFS transporter n=1 Tax=Kordiimonas sp. SCSIO 12610 TaxID=2829597 RepID=UPI00210A97BF|nr:MFS transporter [Kordiimonas sp. SCSIO 12610]UTW55566.1 MFS transporter [Kordiimonas sp. SCSIO 12610]